MYRLPPKPQGNPWEMQRINMLKHPLANTTTSFASPEDLNTTTFTNLQHSPVHMAQGPQQKPPAGPGQHQNLFTPVNTTHSLSNIQGTQQHAQVASNTGTDEMSSQQFQAIKAWQHQQLEAKMNLFFTKRSQAKVSQGSPQQSVELERSQSNPGPETNPQLQWANETGQVQDTGNASQTPRPASSHCASGSVSQFHNQSGALKNINRPFTPPSQCGPSQRNSSYQAASDNLSSHKDVPPHVFNNHGVPDSGNASPMSGAQQTPTAYAHHSRNHSQESANSGNSSHSSVADPNATIRALKRSTVTNSSDLFADQPQQMSSVLLTPPNTDRASTRKLDVASLPDISSMQDISRLLFPQGNDSQTPYFTFDQHTDLQVNGPGPMMIRKGNQPCVHAPTVSSFEMQVQSSQEGSSSGYSHQSGYSNRSSVDLTMMGSPAQGFLNLNSGSTNEVLMRNAYENTGITPEEIQSYIAESNEDPKNPYRCLWDECGKVFGRKENIKAHIQTHLNDRPFFCVVCKKRFVRAHDLKRHHNTHLKVKEHPCECGAAFARRDALTRHKQRGCCEGAFEWVAKKEPVKRGRPKKTRPAGEERTEKATKQRKINRAKRAAATQSDAESISGEASHALANSMPMIQTEDMDIDAIDYSLLHGLQQNMRLGDHGTLTPPHSQPQSPAVSTQGLVQNGQSGNVSSLGSSEPSMHSSPQMGSESSQEETMTQAFQSQEASPVVGSEKSFESDNQSPQPLRYQQFDEEWFKPNTVSPAQMSQNSFDQPDNHIESQQASLQGSLAGSPPELSHSSPPSSATMLDFDWKDTFAELSENAKSVEAFEAISGSNMQAWNDNSLFDFDKASEEGHVDMSFETFNA